MTLFLNVFQLKSFSFLNRIWWPFFVVLFYILSPLPILIANRYNESYDVSNTSTPKDLAYFITAGIVISAYGLPIVLARAPQANPVVSSSTSTFNSCPKLFKKKSFFSLQIMPGACWLTLMGNSVVFATVFGFFYTFRSDNSSGFYY